MPVVSGRPPSSEGGRHVLIVRPGQKYRVRFSSAVEWFWEHDIISQMGKFLGSKPCYQDGTREERCTEVACPYFGAPRYKRGYASSLVRSWARRLKSADIGDVGDWLSPVPLVVRFTPTVKDLSELELPGLVVELWRLPADKFRAFRWTVESNQPATPAPLAFDIRPILSAFWREPNAFARSLRPGLRIVGGKNEAV